VGGSFKSWCSSVFEVDYTVSCSSAFFSGLPAESIEVYLGLTHLASCQFGTSECPKPLDLFLGRLLALSPVAQTKEVAASASSTDQASKARKSRNVTWVEDLRLKKKGAPPSSSSSESEEDLEVAPFLATEEDEAAIWAQLDEAREAVLDFKLRTGDFSVSVLGGKWTFEHKGVAADAVKAYVRGQEAEDFCKSHKTAKSASYHFSTYGQDIAALLARTWAAKMQYCFNAILLKAKGSEASDKDLFALWQEPSEFTQLAEKSAGRQQVMKRVDQIRQLLLA